MPIILNERQVKSKLNHKTVCDYCGVDSGYVDDGYLAYSGYLAGKPKFDIKCSKCHHHQFECNFCPGCLIPGYGRVNKETLMAIQEKQFMASETAKRTTNKVRSIDWASIDKLIDEGKCQVTKLAKELNFNALEFRMAFETHYGDKVVYKRGRSGGVFWAKTEEVPSEG